MAARSSTPITYIVSSVLQLERAEGNHEAGTAGRQMSQRLNGAVLATSTYVSGELSGVSYPTGAGMAGNGSSLSTIGRDEAGRTTGLSWMLPGGQPVVDTVTRSRAGRVTGATLAQAGVTRGQSSYGYDGAGRLTAASVGREVAGVMRTHQLGYGYGTVAGCGTGTVAEAGRNGNRTGGTDVFNAVTATTMSCYDGADRLVSSSGGGWGSLSPSYDGHGNTATIDEQTVRYDAADRHASSVTSGGQAATVGYTRDATDRMVGRSVFPAGGQDVGVLRYGHTAGGDSADYTLSAGNAVLEYTVGLPGGALVTVRADGGATWAYPNVHGDIAATHVSAPPGGGGPLAVESTVTADNVGAYDNGVPVSTAGPGRLLVALVSSDGPSGSGSQQATVSGAGLGWQLIARENSSPGAAEVWAATAATALTGVTVTAHRATDDGAQALTVLAVTNAAVGASGHASGPAGTPAAAAVTTTPTRRRASR